MTYRPALIPRPDYWPARPALRSAMFAALRIGLIAAFACGAVSASLWALWLLFGAAVEVGFVR